MTPFSSASVLPCQDSAFIRLRVQRIEEDIQAAEEKSRRIQNRLERDRHALALWQARMTAIQNETQISR